MFGSAEPQKSRFGAPLVIMSTTGTGHAYNREDIETNDLKMKLIAFPPAATRDKTKTHTLYPFPRSRSSQEEISFDSV